MKTRLGDYIQQIRGVSYKPTDLSETLEDGYITLLRANNISESKVNFLDVQYVNKKKVSTEQILRNDDIIICSSSGSLALVGKSAIYEKTSEHTFGAFCKIVRTKSLLSPHYLAFYMCSRSYRQHIEHVAHGANINNLKNEHIDEIIIEVPSLDKQNLIVKKLRKIKRIIDHRRAQLAKLDELVKCRFVEMFAHGFPKIILGNVFDTCSGGTPSSKNSSYYEGGTIPWLTSGEVNKGIIYYADSFISIAGLENSSAKWVPEDSVVVAMYGATAGKVGIVKYRTTTNQAVCSILPHAEYHPYFVYHAVKQQEDWMLSQVVGGAQQNLSQQIVRRMRIPSPPYSQQIEFANFANSVDKLRFV